MKKDKIIMSNLAFFGYHGVMAEEKALGQKFFVDMTLYLDTQPAGESDDMAMSVHYGEVYQVIKNIVENQVFNLLEALAETIASEVLKGFPLLEAVKVCVKKPEAPVPGIFDYVAVEIMRDRHA